MKKIIALLLALGMLLCLCACGAGTQAAATPEPTPAPTPEPTPAPWETLLAEGQKYYYCLDGAAYDSEKAAELFTQAAELGSGLAHWYLGGLCTRNLDEDRFEKAMAHYEKAAELGCDLGLLGQGELYEYGLGVERDWVKAKALYEQALEKGCVEANLALGGLYENAHGVERDLQKALDYYSAALDSEELSYLRGAYASLGSLYASDLEGFTQDYDKALSWYEQGVEIGSTDAMTGLAGLYRGGTGVPMDTDHARALYEQAAAAGDTSGLTGQGFMAYSGIGGEVDYETALDYYRQAAELGNANGLYWLGVCYAEGHGVAQDGEQGVAYLEQAAAGGETDAYRVIGQFYVYGTGVKQDYAKAREWFEKGVDAGDLYAMNSLGYLYLHGIGVAEDAREAMKWFEQAAEGGNSGSMANLGYMYNWGGWGIDLAVDYVKAAELMERAVRRRPSASYADWWEKNQNISGAYTEGYRCDKGIGVEPDAEKALEWYGIVIAAKPPKEEAWDSYNALLGGKVFPRIGLMLEEGRTDRDTVKRLTGLPDEVIDTFLPES